MQAYASLHTSNPSSQADQEATYKGYARIPVALGEGGLLLRALFPEIKDDSPDVVTHVALGSAEEGDGEIFLVIPCLPHIPCKVMRPGKAPNVVFMYPEALHPVARVTHQLVSLGQMRAADMHASLYEAVNDELDKFGIPVLKVTRSAIGTLTGKLSQMPSLAEWANEGSAN